MQIPLAELAITLFFLSGLVVLSRSKKQMVAESHSSFWNMYAGLLIMNVVALLRLSAETGLAGSIPFLADAPFMQLTQTIGFITGLVLLVSGASDWLPLNKMLRKYSSQKIGRLELLKEVQQLTSVEGKLSTVVSNTLKQMVEHLPVNKGICWQFSSGRSGVSTVTASGLDTLLTHRLASQVKSLNRSQFVESSFDWNSWLERETGLSEPAIVLPVRIDQGVIVLYALYCEDRSLFQKEDMQILRIVGDLIAGYASHERDRRHLSYMHRVSSLQNSIVSGLNHLTETKERFTFASNKLKALCKADLFTMISIPTTGKAQSYTLEPTGFCTTKEIEVHIIDKLTGGEADIAPRLITAKEISNKLMMSSIFGRTDVHSGMLMSLHDEKGLHGLFLSGKFNGVKTTYSEMNIIGQMRSIFTNMVRDEQQESDARVKLQRLIRLVDFQTFSRSFPDSQSLYQHAVGLLAEELGCEMVRISTFEEHGAFLKSQALRTKNSSGRVVPEDGYQVLSIMPNHRLVRKTGRHLLFNQEISTQKMTEGEASQVFVSELKSVLLVPFGIGTKSEGVISIADCRSWNEFHLGEEELILVTGIAGVLSNTMTSSPIKEATPTRQTLTLRRDKEVVPASLDRNKIRTRYIPAPLMQERTDQIAEETELQTTGR